MTGEFSLHNCTTYTEFMFDPRTDSSVSTHMALAAHVLLNNLPPRDEGLLTDQEEARLNAKAMVGREEAYDLLEVVLDEPEAAYNGLLRAIERSCEGDCDDCPLKGIDFTPKVGS